MVDCVDSWRGLLLALAFKHDWTTASLFCPQFNSFTSLSSQNTQYMFFEIGGHKFYTPVLHGLQSC